MKSTCQTCGVEYVQVKPHYVVCFDCYLAEIRTQRRAFLESVSASATPKTERDRDKPRKGE